MNSNSYSRCMATAALHGLAAAACMFTLAGAPAFAADASSWPGSGKPIRIVVPFSAGSGSDSMVRLLANKVTEQTGAPVIIDNKPGAGTIIGAQEVARADPDGYTLLYTIVVTHTQNPHLYKKLPYDALNDFTPILQVVRSATVLVAANNTPFNTTAEMVAYAKANPGKLNYASYSPGSTSHLNGEILKMRTGTDIVHIPYKGTGDATMALLAGDVQIYFDGTATAVENARAGKVKVLGPATDKRLSVMPDMPTLEEQGIPGLNIVGWQGFFAPAGVNPELAERIASVFRDALNTPQVKQTIALQGNELSGAGPKEYAEIVRRDYERWGEVIRHANLSLD